MPDLGGEEMREAETPTRWTGNEIGQAWEKGY